MRTENFTILQERVPMSINKSMFLPSIKAIIRRLNNLGSAAAYALKNR